MRARSREDEHGGRQRLNGYCAAETPPHGVRDAAPGIACAVRDGVVALWTLRSSGRNGDLGDVPDFLRRAHALAVERGLVAPVP